MNIESIFLNKNLENYNCGEIENLSKLNIFVGGNNSGKSRLLRELFNEDELKLNNSSKPVEKYNETIEELIQEINNIKPSNITTIDQFELENLPFKKISYLSEEYIGLDTLKKQLIRAKTLNYGSVSYRGSSYFNKEKLKSDIERISEKYINIFEEMDLYIPKFERVYIPILRSLRKIDEKDRFRERTEKDYFAKKNISGELQDLKFNIFTGQSLYDDVHKLLCGSYGDREHLKDFEKFLGDSFFEGKQVVLIPKINSDVLYVKVGNEKEYPIHQLGDGLQSIIILTFNLFANKGKAMLFFIEEPEIYLHPGLQRKLIDVFLSEEFDSFQYFITTHSNHLLDLTLDIDGISIYKFMKSIDESKGMEEEANFTIENVKNDDNSILEILGVSNSSIFLSNCSIWVEGITDRLYLRKYFEVYQKSKLENKEIDKVFIEDIHYSFLEYSGGNITHWSFLNDEIEEDNDLKSMEHNKLFKNIFLIADSDGYLDSKQGAKAERLNKLEAYFDEQFYCLKVKEIENISTPEVLKKVTVNFIDKRLSEENKQNDSINLFTHCDFTQEDYKSSNLGEFINNKIDEQVKITGGNIRKFNFKKENTINKKVEFCKYAIKEIRTIDDLSDEAKELCGKVYNFIKLQN
ncbi:MAG: AAA family ATPase [Sarcina sp.]